VYAARHTRENPGKAAIVMATSGRAVTFGEYGVPNDDLGEEVKAVVQLADPAGAGQELAGDLIEYCRARLAHFKCPTTVDFAADLPRTPTGKLVRRVLRDRYWEANQTRIL